MDFPILDFLYALLFSLDLSWAKHLGLILHTQNNIYAYIEDNFL